MATTTFEQHHTIRKLAARWGVSYETARQIVMREPGVLKFRGGRGLNTSYRVPESIAERIHNRMSNPLPRLNDEIRVPA